jgi:hypothetical protein
MPLWLDSVGDNTKTFKHPEALDFAVRDSWGQPGGLGWNHGMKWGTAIMFMDFIPAIQATMPLVQFPFFILHDPEDKVCDIAGSQQLVQCSNTAAGDKVLVEVHNNKCFVCWTVLSSIAVSMQF